MTRLFARAAGLAASVTLAATVAIGITGVGLLAFYRPSGSTLSRVLTFAHLAAIAVAAQGIVAVGVIGLIGSSTPGETARRILGLGVALIALVVSIFTGVLLGWDQLALEAVTVGSDLRGYGWLFGDEVEFAIVDGTAVAVNTVQRLLIVHLGSALAVAAAGVVVPRLASKSSRQR